MLLDKIDFDNKTIKEKLELNTKKHNSTWEHYSECYNYTLSKLLEKGLETNNYVFNPCARGILFLLRHSLELTLKNNLSSKGIKFPNSHVFNDLTLAYGDNYIPEEFKKVLDKVDKDTDGTLYRYYEKKPLKEEKTDEGNEAELKKEKTNKPFFEWDENDDCRINLSEIIKNYNNIPHNNDFKLGNICKEFNYDDKIIVWNLTLHMLESKHLSHIKHEYDGVIEILLDGIINEDFDVDKVYLPLLFLIRHSLELALKYNLQEAQKISPDKVSNNDFDKTHSLAKLYNEFGGDNGFLAKIDLTQMTSETQKQLVNFKNKYKELNEIIHQLDSNSYYFRFPVDSKNIDYKFTISKYMLCNISKLLYFTNPFLSFTLLVLEDEGIIEGLMDTE